MTPGKVPSDAEVVPAERDLTGEEFGGCRIQRRLGSGAMGTVYLAEQIHLHRPVALKILAPKYSKDPVYIDRFEREARASARLVHFNVVRVYDFGHVGSTYYIVNEYVDGITLHELLEDRGALDSEEATEQVLQAAHGLAAAEAAGIVHRDIKPDNLMLTQDRTVKIADFGLAKAAREDVGVTQPGIVVGTPLYMSPEQARGEELDVRTDIYSLGVTYFHMLTGQVPFDGDSVVSVVLQHISGERPDPAQVNPGVPRIASEVVLRMMARDRGDRYPGAEKLADALEALLARLRRGDLGEVYPESAAASAGIDEQRARRYKTLKPELVSRLVRREVPEHALDELRDRSRADAGVFVPHPEPFPAPSLVELRFRAPNGTDQVDAVGLVQWRVDQGAQPGMGISLLKVRRSRSRNAKASESALARRARLSCAEVVEMLTSTPRDARLFKYYYANAGHTITHNQIASSLGIGTRAVAESLRGLKSMGLAVERGPGEVCFLWPDDAALRDAMLRWVQQHGLS